MKKLSIILAICSLTIIVVVISFSKHNNENNLPQSINEIIVQSAEGDAEVNYLMESFRARVPIFKKENGTYYTTYDFERNRINGNDTLYVSPDGSDSNSGLSNKFPKRNITSALTSSPNTLLCCLKELMLEEFIL